MCKLFGENGLYKSNWTLNMQWKQIDFCIKHLHFFFYTSLFQQLNGITLTGLF